MGVEGGRKAYSLIAGKVKATSHSLTHLGRRLVSYFSKTMKDSSDINMPQAVQIQKSLKKYQLSQYGNTGEAFSSSVADKFLAKWLG